MLANSGPNPKVAITFLMNSESLLTLDPTTLFYFNLRGCISPPEQLVDVVKSWVAGVEEAEPPSRPASRASETVSAASMLEPGVHMGGIASPMTMNFTARNMNMLF